MPDIAARTIWVGGLPKGVHENELLKAFGKCGRVVETKIRHSQSDTFAFVTFEDEKSYDRALKSMDQSQHFGLPIKVNVVITKTGNDDKGRGSKGGGRGRSDSRHRQDGGWKENYGQTAGWRDRADDDDAYNDPPQRRSLSRPAQRLLRRGTRDGDMSKGRRQYPDVRDVRDVRDLRDVRDVRDVRDTGDVRDVRDRDRGQYDDRERDRTYDDWEQDRGHFDERDREHGRKGRGHAYEEDNRRERDSQWREDRYNRDRSPVHEYERSGGKGRRRLAQPSPSVERTREEELTSSRLWVGGMPKDVTEREMERTFSKHGPVQEIVIRHSEFDTFGFVQYKSTKHAAVAIRELNQTECFAGIIKVAPAGGKGDKSNGKKGDKGSDKGGGRGKKGGVRKGDDWRSRSPRGMRSPSPCGGRKGGRSPMRRRSPRPRGQQQSSVRYCIKLGLLPPDMDAEELFDLGDAYGQVLHHALWSDSKNGCLAGVIEYGVRDDAIKALNDLNDRRMDGWEKKITAGLQQRDG